MPDKIQRYSLHFRHWGNEKKLRMSERDCESKWNGLLVWIHHSHLMPHSFLGIEITNFVCWEIKCSMLCRQCQLNQQHAVWFYFHFFSLSLYFIFVVYSLYVVRLSFYGGAFHCKLVFVKLNLLKSLLVCCMYSISLCYSHLRLVII